MTTPGGKHAVTRQLQIEATQLSMVDHDIYHALGDGGVIGCIRCEDLIAALAELTTQRGEVLAAGDHAELIQIVPATDVDLALQLLAVLGDEGARVGSGISDDRRRTRSSAAENPHGADCPLSAMAIHIQMYGAILRRVNRGCRPRAPRNSRRVARCLGIGTRRAAAAPSMNVSNGYARIARRSTARFLSKRGFWVSTLSLGALASVAFLLWRVRHERTSASAAVPAAAGTGQLEANIGRVTPELRFSEPQRPEPQRPEPQRPELQPREGPELQAERVAPHARTERTAAATADASSTPWVASSSSSEPWDVRAARAVTLGRSEELVRIAGEMDRDGWDSEAGLLRNYALLLERSSASRERVLAEVSRMLEAAGRLRARATPPKNAGRTGVTSAEEVPANEAGAESHVDAPIQPLPMLSIGKAASA
jgi:hypothetical protein